MNMVQTAKILGIGRNCLYELLRQINWVSIKNEPTDLMVEEGMLLPRGYYKSGALVTEAGLEKLKSIYKKNLPALKKSGNRIRFLNIQPEEITKEPSSGVSKELMHCLYDMESITIEADVLMKRMAQQMEKCFEVAFTSR